MSQLYFSSSRISNKRILSLEELFTYYKPEDVILVFDTNIVVDYREFYLSPLKFKETQFSTYCSLRYLVEQIERYNLEINATFGVDESCRAVSDFSILHNKRKQTHDILMKMLYSGIDQFDLHLKKNVSVNSIKDYSARTISKIDSLKERSIGQNLIIVSYLTALKIAELKLKQDSGKINRLEAFLSFFEYATKEIDCVGGTIINYAYHLFGGMDSLKRIILIRKIGKASKENVIHQIFNGAIDLILPYLVDSVNHLFKTDKNYIPVFVTRDERISDIHSLHATKVIFGEGPYSFQLVEGKYSSKRKMNWTEKEETLIKNVMENDIFSRIEKKIPSSGQTTSHLLPLIAQQEKIVLNLL